MSTATIKRECRGVEGWGEDRSERKTGGRLDTGVDLHLTSQIRGGLRSNAAQGIPLHQTTGGWAGKAAHNSQYQGWPAVLQYVTGAFDQWPARVDRASTTDRLPWRPIANQCRWEAVQIPHASMACRSGMKGCDLEGNRWSGSWWLDLGQCECSKVWNVDRSIAHGV